MQITSGTKQRWARNIDAYFFAQRKGNVASDEYLAFNDTLAEILTNAASTVGQRDSWELFMSGTYFEIRSIKLQHGFRFGAWLDARFYMETDVLYAQHISHMPEDFWDCVLQLEKCGRFVFTENAMPEIASGLRSQAKKKVKSNLYRLARHHLLCAAESNNDAFVERDCFEDFGSLEVEWPININVEDLFVKLVEAFTRLYRVNYLLYRYEYMLRHSRRKNGGK